jgi:hypothetical protein
MIATPSPKSSQAPAGNYILDKRPIDPATCEGGDGFLARAGEGVVEARRLWDRAFPELMSLWDMVTTLRLDGMVAFVALLRTQLCSIEKATNKTRSRCAVG